MVMSFMKQSGGSVSVHSEIGVGTTFTLYYPVFEGEMPTEPHNLENDTVLSRSIKSILLVEDEPVLLTKMATLLTQDGFEVQISKSGDEAAKILLEVQGFDLLITDVAMPGTLQGYDLFDYGKQLNPDLKSIIISGYTPSPTDLGGALNSGAKFLRKPVRRKLLLNTVNEMAH
ncbi:response regulator [Parasedimentitalea maritima]|uniref:Response regulator n=2 Tax=Parasedimentitalea maritima TaxID=2578117 RepID=A0A6A4RDN6_9RHOB|nr:response regulator [Zongyanglinia marina]